MGYFKRFKNYARQYWEEHLAPEGREAWVLMALWLIFYYGVYIAATAFFELMVLPLVGLRIALAPLSWLGTGLLDTATAFASGMSFSLQAAAVSLAWVAVGLSFFTGPWATIGMGLSLIGLGVIGALGFACYRVYTHEKEELRLSQEKDRDELPPRPDIDLDSYHNDLQRSLDGSLDKIFADFHTYNYLTREEFKTLIGYIERVCQQEPPDYATLAQLGYELTLLLNRVSKYSYRYVLDPSEVTPIPKIQIEEHNEEESPSLHRTINQHTENMLHQHSTHEGEEEEKSEEPPGRSNYPRKQHD